MSYILVNPKLNNSTFSSKKKNGAEAAEDIWSQLSANIKNYTPKFYFTIQEAGNSKLSHYVIKESMENDKVKYNLKEFKGKKVDEKTFINELKQQGGKKHRRHRHRDDDDDSDSDSDNSSSSSELMFTFPTGKTHRDISILTYYPTIYGVPNVVLPTFATSFIPFTNVRLIPNMLVITP
jgi:hypothetical protein